ncbi:hypothetical protein [Actinomyces succiniciruminis]|uniref:TrbL/VirB6 plasmid conjugal transfer protein n=1 Tax=Actinomyces succiniciruminis TaxID=1522002 RepID=A0A1L7RPM4_9ACTO|nr:hypothetical protein [Actinomyces succiniciruminis]CED91294.1 Hypothetical protein AAM4_1462 [Actinomyces succiniciruminis]
MADCEWYQLTCHLGSGVSDVVSTVSTNVVKAWGDAVLEGMDKVLVTLGTFWVDVPTPDVSSTGSVTVWSQSITRWLVLVLAAFALLSACVMLIWQQRGETVKNIASGLLKLIIVSAASVTVGQSLVDASDATASWTLEQATGEAGGNFAAKLMTISTVSVSSLTLIVVIVVGLIGLIANLVQIGMMFVRSAMLVLLLSMIPMAAAATMTEWGQQWLKKMIGWFMAFVALKPTAALIYAIAIKLVEGNSYDITDDGELLNFILGVMMMILAAFALPTLVAFVLPAVGAMGSAGAGAAAGAAVGALATGAMSLSRGDGGGSGASGPPPDAASDADTSTASTGTNESTGSDQAPASGGTGGVDTEGPAGGADAASGSAAGGESGMAAAGEGAGGAGSAAVGAGAAAASGGVLAAVQVAAKGVEAASDAANSAADDATGAGEVAR